MGFFLHTPFPVPEIWVAAAQPRHAIPVDVAAYDVVGFQTDRTAALSSSYLVERDGREEVVSDKTGCAPSAVRPVEAIPISIETGDIRE